MNPLLLMILTVLANAIVTGIIVYRLQKKIDNTYAKQMEEFRANLQYSNFEQQTKFARIHEKRVETLEGAYQRFLVFGDALLEVIMETSILEKDTITRSRYVVGKQEELGGKLNDFWHYCAVNRLSLADSVMDEIRKILDKALALRVVTLMFIGGHDRGVPLPVEWADSLAKTIGIEARGREIATPSLFLNEISKELGRQTKKLEKLYRSVADTAEKESQVINKKS